MRDLLLLPTRGCRSRDRVRQPEVRKKLPPFLPLPLAQGDADGQAVLQHAVWNVHVLHKPDIGHECEQLSVDKRRAWYASVG